MYDLSGNIIPRLPSQDAVIELYEGKPGGLRNVVLSTLARALIISPGLYIAGSRGKELAKQSIAAASAIETFVILHTFLTAKKDESEVIKK